MGRTARPDAGASNTEFVALFTKLLARLRECVRDHHTAERDLQAAADDRHAAARSLLDAGASARTVAEAIGTTDQSILRWAGRAGWVGAGSGLRGRCVRCGGWHDHRRCPSPKSGT